VDAKSAAFDKADAAKIKMVVLTGSNIPQKATKAGRLPDTAQPLTVITGEEIEHSGATTVAGALRRMVPQIH
jgi:outer membrane cobalamin receptor